MAGREEVAGGVAGRGEAGRGVRERGTEAEAGGGCQHTHASSTRAVPMRLIANI